jgi:hypothetical protein
MSRHRRKTRNDFSAYYGEVMRVVWEDICEYDDVKTEKIVKDSPLLMETFGLCVHDSKTALFVAHTLPIDRKDKKLEQDSVFRIPKRSIDSISVLEVQK